MEIILKETHANASGGACGLFFSGTFDSDTPIQRRRSDTSYFDYPVAEQRNIVCPTASRPMRVTAP